MPLPSFPLDDEDTSLVPSSATSRSSSLAFPLDGVLWAEELQDEEFSEDVTASSAVEQNWSRRQPTRRSASAGGMGGQLWATAARKARAMARSSPAWRAAETRVSPRKTERSEPSSGERSAARVA